MLDDFKPVQCTLPLRKKYNLFQITVLCLDIQCIYFGIFFITFRVAVKYTYHKVYRSYFRCTVQWH